MLKIISQKVTSSGMPSKKVLISFTSENTPREFLVIDTEQPWETYGTGGEYQKGGLLVQDRLAENKSRGSGYVGNFEHFDDVKAFVRLLRAQNVKIESYVT